MDPELKLPVFIGFLVLLTLHFPTINCEINNSGDTRARSAHGRSATAKWILKVTLPIPENLVITWPYTAPPSVRTTGEPMFDLTLSRSNWPRTRKSNYYKEGRQLLFTLLTMITLWSRSSSNFYAVIGQNLTVEFMRKMFAASWILFTLKTEAVWVLCQLDCDVFNCLFPLDVQNEIQLLSGVFCYSWLVCLLGFWLRNTSLVKVGWHRFRVSPFLMRKRVEKYEAILALPDSFQELHLEW